MISTRFGMTDSRSGSDPPAPLAYERPIPLRVDDSVDLYFPDRIWDLFVPVAMLALGMAIGCGVLLYEDSGVKAVAVLLSSYLVFRAILLACLIPVLSRLCGVSFGSWPSAVLKLAAICVLPEAVVIGIVEIFGICLGVVLAIPVGLVFAMTMFMKLFDLDLSEASLCVVLTWGTALACNSIWWWVGSWMARILG
jgi:hypothetical protein